MIIWILILMILGGLLTKLLIVFPLYLLGLIQTGLWYGLLFVLLMFLAWCFRD